MRRAIAKGTSVRLPKTAFLLPLLTLGLLAATGCESTHGAAPTPVESIVGDWTLDRIVGGDGEVVPADAAARPTLTVGEDGRLSGFSGVNRYTGSLSVDALARGLFNPGPVAATKMAGPPAAMDLESQFLETLGRADAYSVEGDVLVLEGGGKGLLHFLKTSR